MRFLYVNPLSCGNAVRLIVAPSMGESRWRILRKEVDDFAGPFDPAAFVVHDGSDQSISDARLLVNGITYFYRIYGALPEALWSVSAVAQAVPQATFDDLSVDAQELVRERLDVTLNNMIARGKLPLSKPSLPVLSIPFAIQGIELPVVTVLFGGESQAARGLGDFLSQSDFVDGQWVDSLGWLSAITLDIMASCLNAQERNLLRRALQAAVVANLSVFDDMGLQMPEIQSVQDTEDFQSMNVPVYQTSIRFGCTAATATSETYGSITDVVLISPTGGCLCC